MPAELLSKIYLVTSIIGFLYVVGGSVMGMGQGKRGIAKGGSGKVAGRGGGKVAKGASGKAGHRSGKGGSAKGKIAKGGRDRGGPDGGEGDAAGHQLTLGAGKAGRQDRAFFWLMQHFNPLTIATVLFFFGITGLAVSKYFPAVGILSALIALAASFWFTGIFQYVQAVIMANLQSQPCFMLEDTVGTVGEISISIPEGGTGEIVFVGEGGRCNYPARLRHPYSALSKGSQAIILDVDKGIMEVEAYADFND